MSGWTLRQPLGRDERLSSRLTWPTHSYASPLGLGTRTHTRNPSIPHPSAPPQYTERPIDSLTGFMESLSSTCLKEIRFGARKSRYLARHRWTGREPRQGRHLLVGVRTSKSAMCGFFVCSCIIIFLLSQGNTVLHLDVVTGAVRRLLLSQDTDEPAPSKASNWWSSKEEQVRGHAINRHHNNLITQGTSYINPIFVHLDVTQNATKTEEVKLRTSTTKSERVLLDIQKSHKMCREFAHKNWLLFYKEDG